MHPTEKKMGETVFEVFSQGLEEMHQELSKDGEDHKLGDVPLGSPYIYEISTRI